MSFSIQHKGERGAVVNAIHADTSVPEGVKHFINAGVNAIKGDGPVEVKAYGHLHNGEEGNVDETSATISVKPVVDETAAS